MRIGAVDLLLTVGPATDAIQHPSGVILCRRHSLGFKVLALAWPESSDQWLLYERVTRAKIVIPRNATPASCRRRAAEQDIANGPRDLRRRS